MSEIRKLNPSEVGRSRPRHHRIHNGHGSSMSRKNFLIGATASGLTLAGLENAWLNTATQGKELPFGMGKFLDKTSTGKLEIVAKPSLVDITLTPISEGNSISYYNNPEGDLSEKQTSPNNISDGLTAARVLGGKFNSPIGGGDIVVTDNKGEKFQGGEWFVAMRYHKNGQPYYTDLQGQPIHQGDAPVYIPGEYVTPGNKVEPPHHS